MKHFKTAALVFLTAMTVAGVVYASDLVFDMMLIAAFVSGTLYALETAE